MNYNQLEKIKQLTDQTLIIGTDVSKNFHVSRAPVSYTHLDVYKRQVFNIHFIY